MSDGIKLTPIKRDVIDIHIAGISPLIPHKWSEKSRQMMREKQTGPKARTMREPKDIQAEAEASLYRLDDGRPGMPATAFKSAIAGAARLYEGVTMASLKAAVFVQGEGDDQLVAIDGNMTLREDTPRNSGGVCDLRYRFSFHPWSAVLRVAYIPVLIDRESLVNLVDASGNGGIGDWRPSAPKSLTGTFGRYEVVIDGMAAK